MVYFLVLSVLPGFGYQYIQDELRTLVVPVHSTSSPLAYVLGIAPNLLGGLSLTAGLIAFSQDRFPTISSRKIWHTSGGVALVGLWVWEILQIHIPNATFDVHDLLWTIPGVLLAVLLAALFLAPEPSARG